MKPIIGITASTELNGVTYHVHQDHVRAVLGCGGVPFLLPYMLEKEHLDQIVSHIDGLYATGGYDIDPTLFGEEPHPGLGTIIPDRDQFECRLMEKMLTLDKPILGICRGSQILNIVAGGDMYQDIYTQIEQPLLQHQQKAPSWHGSHYVDVTLDSLLYRLTKKERFKINSRHHQANRHIPIPFEVSGRSSDGVIEAIESKTHHFVLGLQWHPENLLQAADEVSLNIFCGFISACQEGKK